MRIHPIMSGTAIIMMAKRCPNLEPKTAAAKPPKMAPMPKIPAIQDPDSMSRGKGWYGVPVPYQVPLLPFS